MCVCVCACVFLTPKAFLPVVSVPHVYYLIRSKFTRCRKRLTLNFPSHEQNLSTAVASQLASVQCVCNLKGDRHPSLLLIEISPTSYCQHVEEKNGKMAMIDLNPLADGAAG